MNVKMIAAGIAIIIVGILIFTNVYIVDEGERAIVVNLGKVDRVQNKGLHAKIPFVESKYIMSVRVQAGTFTQLGAYTNDNQVVTSDLLVPYRLREDALTEIYVNYGARFESRLMRNLVEGSLREAMGDVNTITLAAEREKVALIIGKRLAQILDRYGVTVVENDVKLENVKYSPQFEKRIARALEEKAEVEKARQNARRKEQEAIARRAEAKGFADAEREKADGVAYRTETVAKADAKAIRLRADADAHAIREKGQAEAEALRKRGESIKQNPQLVGLLRAEAALKWNGKLPDRFIPGSALPILEVGGLAQK